MIRAVALLALLAGCLADDKLDAAQDPFCPHGWKFDLSANGYCSPPTGYTALVWAEIGGSGTYGFVRSGSQYLSCRAQSETAICSVRMIGATQIDAYTDADVTDTTIRANALPVGSTMSSISGVYKLRLDPGTYRVTGTDPVDGTRFWSGHLTVVPQALATCVIDVYPP